MENVRDIMSRESGRAGVEKRESKRQTKARSWMLTHSEENSEMLKIEGEIILSHCEGKSLKRVQVRDDFGLN